MPSAASASALPQSLQFSPAVQSSFDQLYAALFSQPHLPAQILALTAHRLAQLHRLQLPLSLPLEVPAPRRENLSRWHEHSAYDAADRACLSFAEVYAADPQAITDDQAAAVKQHFGDEGLVTLIEALGILDGLIRTQLLWQASGPSMEEA